METLFTTAHRNFRGDWGPPRSLLHYKFFERLDPDPFKVPSAALRVTPIGGSASQLLTVFRCLDQLAFYFGITSPPGGVIPQLVPAGLARRRRISFRAKVADAHCFAERECRPLLGLKHKASPRVLSPKPASSLVCCPCGSEPFPFAFEHWTVTIPPIT